MMTPTLNVFLEVMRESFSPGISIEADVAFRELEEWSSMQALIVIAAVDEHFGVTLPEKDFRSAKTFHDLHRLTVSLKENV